MRRAPWATYLWPGLPALWVHGQWSGLLLATVFAVLLNLLLLTTLIWVELFGSSLRAAGWIAVGAVWMISLVSLWRSQSSETATESTAPNSDLFRRAQREYLKGNWFEAESILSGRLKAQASDPEARLLLATLLRHTKRHKEAREQLAQLERLDAANRWTTEIAAEKAALLAAAPNLETMLSEKLSQLQAAAAVGTKASQAA